MSSPSSYATSSSPKSRQEESDRRVDDPYNKESTNTKPDSSQTSSSNSGVQQTNVGSLGVEYPANYDSMSTILEVESEESEPDLATYQRDVGSSTASGRAAGLLGRVSPIGSGRWGSEENAFSGTLNALAQQVERLRRSSTSYREPENHTDSSERSSESEEEKSSERVKPKRGEVEEAQNDRAQSAESLMMIAISPMVSPRVKTGSEFRNKDQTQLVEVSNKSTMTAIDLKLMSRMVEKFFVETREQSSQSIEFDCLDEFESTAEGAGMRSRPRYSKNSSASQTSVRVQTRSVAIGTESFSRERFSLLPPTKTRSTQTRPNLMDSDIGVSDTRLFKLSHLDLIRPSNRTNHPASVELEKQARISSSGELKASEVTPEPQLDSLNNSTSDDKKAKAVEVQEPMKSKPQIEPTRIEDSLESPESESSMGEPVKTESDSISENPDSNKASVEAKSTQPLIPSVKTELKLIIEVKNSRERQVSELKSESMLTSDGKISKSTDLRTRKHLALTPREVLERLRSVGQAHSLLYQELEPPAEFASKPTSPNRSWRQVSESSVRNDIETDARKRPSKSNTKPFENESFILSSDAKVEHRADDKSAVELRSSASRRVVSPAGKVRQTLLVDSEAAFDERDVEASPGEKIVARPSPRTVEPQNFPEPPNQFRKESPRATPTILKRRQTTFEMEEETEDRHSITKNGRLVYDDRIQQRRYETQRASSASPATNETHLRRPASLHSRLSPQYGLFDGISNLSSDPETMDSGIVQSAGGSGSALNQVNSTKSTSRRHTTLANRVSSPPNLVSQSRSVGFLAEEAKRPPANNEIQRHLESITSLDPDSIGFNFMDDEDDELVEQLGGSTPALSGKKTSGETKRHHQQPRRPKAGE